MKKYKNTFVALLFAGMASLLFGITYSFFNYTRTGSENVFSVGNISFESLEGPAINLSNAFPIDSEDIDTDTDNVGSVTINVTGSTNYSEGIEYVVSVVDMNNVTSGLMPRQIPISMDVTYTNNGTGTSIGTLNNNYFDEGERGGDTSYYKVLSTNIVRDGDKVVVGYIAPGETGINGNITIKAYLDNDHVAISDTVPRGDMYRVNPNMTAEELSQCVSIFSTMPGSESITQSVLENFCNGTGAIIDEESNISITFQDMLDYRVFDTMGMTNYLLNYNIIEYSHHNGTLNEWVRDRMILKTSEWNSFNSNGISFKVKVEANEGIWVEEPGKIAACPNCKFMAPGVLDMYTTWNTENETPTVINEELSYNYLDIVGYGHNHFLGLILNDSNQITRAYACGLNNNVPVCVEGTNDGSLYANNQTYLQSESVWNNTCIVDTDYNHNYEFITCGARNINRVEIEVHDHGCASVFANFDGNFKYCHVDRIGSITCGIDFHE